MRSRLIAGLLFVSLLAAAGKVVAHPLGNFSISQYSAIGIHRDEIRLRYIVDLAEIPTFQEIQESGMVPKAGHPGLETYLVRKSELLRDGLKLEVNGARLTPSLESREIIFPTGAGGLPTMKIGILYKAKLPVDSKAGEYLISYRDNNFAGRAGWKEIIAVAEPGVRIVHSSAPETDRSSRLNDYPTDLLNSPPQELEAIVGFTVSPPAPRVGSVEGLPASGSKVEEAAPAPTLETPRSNAQEATHAASLEQARHTPVIPSDVVNPELSGTGASIGAQLQVNRQATPRNSFTELMASKQLGPGLIFVALAVAVGLGAFHALEPGHGKTLVAAYLVGSRGTVKHAFLLGLIVTGAHTAGVYLLGAVTLYASRYVVPERLYPWLAVVSGVMIAALGAVLLVRRYLGKDAISTHHHHHHGDHAHDSGHGHPHSHNHSHDHEHKHLHYDSNHAVSLRELMTLGISGGIVPCPAALVVLLSAVSMQRIGLGLLLIVSFSVGLATVLTMIGLFMVYARQWMSGFQPDHRLTTRWLPLMSSAFILVFGIALTLQALRSAGILPAHL